ncbi:MAG: hypothetical protein AABX05_05780 [Nanoarchaeota archaeon]
MVNYIVRLTPESVKQGSPTIDEVVKKLLMIEDCLILDEDNKAALFQYSVDSVVSTYFLSDLMKYLGYSEKQLIIAPESYTPLPDIRLKIKE